MNWLTLICTNSCNFSCKTCLREYGRSENISLDLIRSIIPEIKRLGYLGVSFTGGEPCLHPQFKELVSLFIENGFITGFVSNGSLIHEYKFLITDYFNSVHFAAFSLDGATQEIHDNIRQPGSYVKVLNAIRLFRAAGIFTKITVCLNRHNLHQLKELMTLAESYTANMVIFTTAITTTENSELVLNEQEKCYAVDTINSMRNNYGPTTYICSSLQTGGGINFCNVVNGLSEITINPKGELVFCCDTIRDGAVLGSLAENSLLDLYYKALDMSTHIKKIRAANKDINGPSANFNTCEFCNTLLEKYIS